MARNEVLRSLRRAWRNEVAAKLWGRCAVDPTMTVEQSAAEKQAIIAYRLAEYHLQEARIAADAVFQPRFQAAIKQGNGPVARSIMAAMPDPVARASAADALRQAGLLETQAEEREDA